MNIYSDGYIVNNIYNDYISSVDREIHLTSLLSLDMNILMNYFKGISVIPVFRILILNDDESVHYEISKDVVSASLSISYQSGQRRTANLTLANESGHWVFGVRNTLWHGMKFRIDCGAVIDNVLYWQQQGVFLLQEPSFSLDSSNKTVGITLCDKWGLWDGTVYGNTQFKTIVPQGIPMRQAFDSIIHENNNTGKMWDTKPIKFNVDYWSTNTYYTIKQDAGQAMAENLQKMATTISSDLYYDSQGCMNVESNVLDFMNNNFPVVWRFVEGDKDCSAPSLKYSKSKYYNKIITKGNIVNGYQFSASVENKNPESIYNVIDTPITPKVNSNTHLYADSLCLMQSMYEMVEQSRGLMAVTMTTGYLPFLDVNQAVELYFPTIGVDGVYIIDSISYNISTVCTMSLSLTSANEVIF